MKHRILIPLIISFALLSGCESIRSLFGTPPLPTPQPFQIEAPANLPDPLPVNGWVFVRTSINGGMYFPPSPPLFIGKLKIKDSGNTDVEVKDKSVEKDKSKIKDSFQEDSQNKSKDGAVVGDNSSAEQKKGIPPAVIYVGAAVAFIGLLLFLFYKAKKKVPLL